MTRPRGRPPGHTFTHRQRQILNLRFDGMTYQEVADRLGIAHSSVHEHIGLAYRLLGCHTLKEAHSKLLALGEGTE